MSEVLPADESEFDTKELWEATEPQTQTHVWSLAGEEAVSYSLARGKAAAVTRESGEIAAYSLAPWREQSLAPGPCCLPGQRENTETVAKLPQPAQPSA